ncbi:MAG: phosphoglucosamine mutase, partial [Bacteroidota bacterium]
DKNYDLTGAFTRVRAKFPTVPSNNIDGLKLDFPDGWVHLRSSNTEPIVRVYAEANSAARARELGDAVKAEL